MPAGSAMWRACRVHHGRLRVHGLIRDGAAAVAAGAVHVGAQSCSSHGASGVVN